MIFAKTVLCNRMTHHKNKNKKHQYSLAYKRRKCTALGLRNRVEIGFCCYHTMQEKIMFIKKVWEKSPCL